jgi:hypothetical protein
MTPKTAVQDASCEDSDDNDTHQDGGKVERTSCLVPRLVVTAPSAAGAAELWGAAAMTRTHPVAPPPNCCRVFVSRSSIGDSTMTDGLQIVP